MDSIDVAFAELEKECTDIVRGMTVDIFHTVLQWSPQSKGVFVSSWQYNIGSPIFWTNPEFVGNERETYVKGNPPAIQSAKEYNAGDEAGFKLGDTVFISNGAESIEGEYAGLVEAGLRLRPENRPGRPLGRAVDRTATWFKKDMSPAHAAAFKAMRIY